MMIVEKKDNLVYSVSLAVMVLLVGWGLLDPEAFSRATSAVFNFFATYIGWWYMLAMNCFVFFPIFLAVGKFGGLKLGADDSRPEFSTIAWFGMLFGAGMGVGLVFYGVGEPLYHLLTPPFGAEPNSARAAQDAMRASFFHWGLHPWAGYAVIALCMAYFQFRKGAPALMSSLLLPFLGPNGHRSGLARAVNVLTIFATVAGVATSIGLAISQINSGLEYTFGLPKSTAVQLVILLIIGFVYTFTAVTGIDSGIKFLGNLNMFLACMLAVLLLLLGPTLAIIETLVTATGNYFQNLIAESFDVAPYGGDYKKWLGSWTIFYWAWWIAWAPFVGSFIARISRGRTIRQFVAGGLLVPTLGSFTWFSIFGGTALEMQLAGVADIAGAVNADLSTAVFAMYEHVPLGSIMGVLMVLLISTFLVTSANASTFVLSMYSTEGTLNPPKSRMLVWGVLQAALAFVLLNTGGLGALQTASIAAAAPFSIIMVLACWCLWKSLNADLQNPTAIQ